MISIKRIFGSSKKAERTAMLLILDVLSINAASFLALFVRYEFNFKELLESGFLDSVLRFAPVNTILTVVILGVFQLYRSMWKYAGVAEFERTVLAVLTSGAVQILAMWLSVLRAPRSYPLLYALFLGVLVCCVRFSYRIIRRGRAIRRNAGATRTMLIGAGSAGNLVLREFLTSKFSKNRIVCIIDDDRNKHGERMCGVPVVGDRNDIEYAAQKYKVKEIVIAIPTLSNSERKAIIEICGRTGCALKTVPGIYQLVNGEISIKQIRDVGIEDLLERAVIKTDIDKIAEYVRGKTVLVTGVGSIGSELARQIAAHSPRRLVLFDIYENNAYAVQQELIAKYPDLKLDVLIGSVRDFDRINFVMKTFRPDIVYHAAAHKHVPLMEDSPLEAIKNNVFGTYNTARAASENGVGKFVLISSDKAVNPTNVMGATKRICEMIIQDMDETSETSFAAVRFGNVLGSNGSVIPLFRQQIKDGGPVTVTHPDVTRYFMTIPEAVSLVLQAGAYSKGGEIFVLDMGKPVKIDDLARNLIRLSGFEPDVDIKIVYTGLRPGEKLYEELLMDEEGMEKTANDLIYIGKKMKIDRAALENGLNRLRSFDENDIGRVRSEISAIVDTYRSPDSTDP
ncbi:MAG: nucleoside-diphosphate sugar epimerase/dehydratase [Firmicutes bacterium]|nr:nucleoside-diphosphate sugar epimerase/dehydratase [Bacillota bacterium]